MSKRNILSLYIIIAVILLFSSCSDNESIDNGQNNNLTNEIVGKDGATMVLIPAGEFLMGSYEGNDDEKPVHTVYLDAFYMDKYEVTNAQYKKFMDATTHKASYWWNDSKYNAPNQPVIGITWEDATAYAMWSGKRLPTEEEWEKAARGGLEWKLYIWGNDWPPPNNSGNFADETLYKILKAQGPVQCAIPCPDDDYNKISGYDDGYAYTAPVGKFTPNGYGLYDMAGNVGEFCSDTYGKTRGSTYVSSAPDFIRASSRNSGASSPSMYIGFRCAMDVPK
ncbi:MAG: formylglycine-generating enzyme family protein [Candidatus Poribacteria bacterium]